MTPSWGREKKAEKVQGVLPGSALNGRVESSHRTDDEEFFVPCLARAKTALPVIPLDDLGS